MRSRRVFLSVLANWYGVGVTIVTQLAQVPIFLSFWPKALYGDWLILYSIPSILIFADFGIASVTANRISMAIGNNDFAAARRVLHSGFAIVVLVGLTIFLAVVAGAWMLDVRAIFGMSSMTVGECRWVLCIFGAIVGLWLSQPLLLGIFQGNHAFALGVFLTNSVRLLTLPAIGGSLLLKSSPVAIAGAILAIQLLGYGAVYLFCWWRYPNLRCGIRSMDRPLCLVLAKEGFSAFGVTLSTVIAQHGMTLVVARTMTSADVVSFTAIRTLTRTASLVAASVRGALIPEFSFLYGKKDSAAWRRLLVTATLRLSGFASVAAVALVALAPMILQAWTKGAVIVAWPLIVPFVLASVFQSISLVPNGAVFSTNQTGILSPGMLVAACVGVVCGYGLTPHMDLAGIGIGTAIGEFLALLASAIAVMTLYYRRIRIHPIPRG